MEITNSFLAVFFESLNKNGVKYCVLRNYHTLPENLNGSDIDILIHRNSLDFFYSTLDSLLDQYNFSKIIKYGKITPRICIAGVSKGEFFGVQLDIHEGRLPYKGWVKMFGSDLLFSRKTLYNGLYVANQNDDALLSFLKSIIHNKSCKISQFKEAKIAWDSEFNLYKEMIILVYNKSFLNELNKTLADRFSEKGITSLAQKGRLCLIKKNFLNVLSGEFGKLKRIFYPPGFSVAFLGVDGAGKSTIINALRDLLNESVHNNIYYEHLRPNFLPSIAKLLGKEGDGFPVQDPHAKKPNGYILSFLRLIYYGFDYIIGYWLKVYSKMIKRSSIIFFDRYHYDYILDPKRMRVKMPRFILRFYCRILPKPDLIICLTADPSVIVKRKPELSISEINKQIKILNLLNNEFHNMLFIQTDIDVDKSIEIALSNIIKVMSKRYDYK